MKTREQLLAERRVRDRVWRDKNRERVRQVSRDWSRKWRAENPELALEAYRRSYANNPDAARKRSSNYIKRNPHVNRENAARSRCHRAALPPWANRFFIREIYILAELRTQALGERYTVDHIVPLNHPLVCGLHCEQNLQIITHRANSGKRNLYWPDMPERGGPCT